MTIVVIKCVKNLSLPKSWNRLSTFAGITMNDLNLKSGISKRVKPFFKDFAAAIGWDIKVLYGMQCKVTCTKKQGPCRPCHIPISMGEFLFAASFIF